VAEDQIIKNTSKTPNQVLLFEMKLVSIFSIISLTLANKAPIVKRGNNDILCVGA
jgi:hypothetical protein